MMTYGEKRIYRQNSINFKKGINEIVKKLEDRKSLPPRLPQEKAFAYYNEKLQKAFARPLEQKEESAQKPKVIMLY